jgi:hypothetical protein
MDERSAATREPAGEAPAATPPPGTRQAGGGLGAAVWRLLASTELAIWLLLAMSLALAVGSQYAKREPAVAELNFLRFQEWLAVRGATASWWLWVLFALLLAFGLNTAVCTTERLAFLLRRRREFRSRAFAVTVAPSIMHLLFLVIVSGHAVSQFTATIRRMPAAEGARLSLSTGVIEVERSECTHRAEPGLTHLVQGCSASLSLSSPGRQEERTVAILHPIRWQGYSIHLKPKGLAKPGGGSALELVVKRDAGLPLIIAGNVVLSLLMLWYFPIVIRKRNGDRSCARA